MKETPPKAGDVYIKGKDIRRVIDVVHGWVCYSNGGNHNEFCTLTAWYEWCAHADQLATA